MTYIVLLNYGIFKLFRGGLPTQQRVNFWDAIAIRLGKTLPYSIYIRRANFSIRGYKCFTISPQNSLAREHKLRLPQGS